MSDLSSRWQTLFWALPADGAVRSKARALEIDMGTAIRERDRLKQENQTLRGDISKLRTMLVAATQTPESALRAMEAALASPATERPNGAAQDDGDRCPSTGEMDCQCCSGEHCDTHGNEPCECDVVQRHTRPAAAVVGQTETKGDS